MTTPLWGKIERWKAAYGAKARRGATDDLLVEAEKSVGTLPFGLREFLRATNGISLNSFRLFPVFDRTDIKGTWESLQRMNDPTTTPYLAKDVALLARFLVFSDIGGGDCAVIDRGDQSIWYAEGGELHQTDHDVVSFVEASLQEQSA